MQIMPTNSNINMSQYAAMAMDMSQSSFLDSLQTELNLDQDLEFDEYNENSNNSNSPYTENVVAHSLFVPQPIRLNSNELQELSDALQADGVNNEAIAILHDLKNKIGGTSLEELMSELRQVLQGGDVELTDQELTVLQNLSFKLQPETPDKIYNIMRFGSSKNALESTMTSLKESGAALSEDELAVLGKVLGLNEGSLTGFVEHGQGFTNKSLTSCEVDELFKNVSAFIENEQNQQSKLEASLEKNLKSVVRDAAQREEKERQSSMLESKSVNQSKVIMEDTAVTRAMGDQLNRRSIEEDSKADKSSFENKSDTSENKKLVQENNSLAQGIVEKTRVEKYFSEQNQLQSQLQNKDEEVNAENIFLKQKNDEIAHKELNEGKNDNALLQNTKNNEVQENKNNLTVENRTIENKVTENNSQNRSLSEEKSSDSKQNKKQDVSLASAAQSGSMAKMNSFANQISSEKGQVGNNFPQSAELEIQNQIQNSILSMAKNGLKTLEVSLTSAEFGSLQVSLTSNNGEMNAVVRAERAESAALINTQMDALRAELENQGFKIEKISVEVGLQEESKQGWQGMNSHNSQRDLLENSQYLERIRNLNKLGINDTANLARNMHNNSQILNNTAINSNSRLYVVA